MENKTTYKIKDVSEGTESGKYLSGKYPKFRFTSIGRIFVTNRDILLHAKLFVNNWRKSGQGKEPMNWAVERTIGDVVDTMPIEDYFESKGFSKGD